MAEIRITDLSIGDWVNFESNGRYMPIMVFEISSYRKEIVGETTFGRLSFKEEEISPIPLTPKILEKNGFEKNSECCWRNSAIECACLRYGTKYWDIRIKGRNRVYRPIRIIIDNILHTHQLQHALRLAGVEKEMVL